MCHQVGLLFALLTDRREDYEFVLQLTLTFQQLLKYPDTRNVLLQSTQVLTSCSVNFPRSTPMHVLECASLPQPHSRWVGDRS